MAKQAMEWIRALTPIAVIALGGLVGWVRLNDQVMGTVKALESECNRSKEADKAQDAELRKLQVTVAEMGRDVSHVKEGVDDLDPQLAAILQAIRDKP